MVLNILVVVGTLSGIGGIETCVRTLALEAEAHGDHVRVLALCPSMIDGQWHEGLAYSEVPNGSTSLKWQMFRGLPAIVRACKAQAPDVIVAIYGSSIPLIRAALVVANLKRPVMSWLHFSTVHAQRTNLLRYAHGHICISSQLAKATRELDGVDADSVHLVYNGARFETASLLDRSTGGPLRLLHVGRLMIGGQKRTDDLLRALARVQGDWRLDIVGTAEGEDDIGQLQRLAVELGIAERLNWLGWRPDPWAAVNAADLLVLCSAFEGFPMVLIEAMGRGVPCISSDCLSGPSDIVRPGRNGWLYAVGDDQVMARQIQRVIDDRSLLPAPSAVRASVTMFSSSSVFQRIRSAMTQTIQAFGGTSAA